MPSDMNASDLTGAHQLVSGIASNIKERHQIFRFERKRKVVKRMISFFEGTVS